MFYGTKILLFKKISKLKHNFCKKYFCVSEEMAIFEDKIGHFFPF